MSSLAIIIPCFNEEKRLNQPAFNHFVKLYNKAKFLLINDGSTDNTLTIIRDIAAQNENAEIINIPKNVGKGEAVRQGIIYALKSQSFDYIGFLDADLSTSMEEYYMLYSYAQKEDADFIFGSRIKMLGSDIKRSFLRHVIGRLIVTFLDKKFQLGYYDTQCGAKIFKSFILEKIIQQPFSTRWFFDLEIFLRLKKENKNYFGIEYPLKTWRNVKGSKLTVLSFPSVCNEIFILFSKY